MGRYRLTVDTGGTFSDFVYLDEETGEVSITKVPSTPDDPSRAILHGVEALLSKGVRAEEIGFFCHGTTVGTNALLERKGVKTGLLVTQGFRAVYEVAEQSRPYGSAIFDVMYDKPALLVPRSLTGEVKERIDFQGNVLCALDEPALRETLRGLSGEGIESIAVCLLFSFLHPQHEARIAQIIAEEMPGVSISLSSEILPQIREYYRLSTTVINAYLQPILARYVAQLDRRLADAGIDTRQKYIMQSNGGMSVFAAASKKAVATVLSGPAGGVTAGAYACHMTGFPNIVTFDMGGTSCDVALIREGEAFVSNRGKIDGRDIAIPMMDINTVSAGGGTIARLDRFGILGVGPDSAGAVPGPACYGRGGTMPAITDCNLLLGYLCEENFLGGRMRLSSEKARQAVADNIANPLQMDLLEAAEGIVRIINIKMEEAIKAISTMRGHDLRDFMLLAFGGAGPIHAGSIARDLGMAGIIVPLYPGVYSAIGLMMSDVKHDYIQSKLSQLDATAPDEVGAMLGQLAGRAQEELRADGFAAAQIRVQPALDMRYAGQGYEITIACEDLLGRTGDLGELRRRFDRQHQSMFGHMAQEEPVEIVSYRMRGIGMVPSVEMPRFARAGTSLADAHRETRKVRFDGIITDCPVYQRERLDVDLVFSGPAVVEQFDCTTVVYPGQTARVDNRKNLILRLRRDRVRKEQTPSIEVDAIDLEVVKASLSGIVQEMQNSLFRTGFSTIVRESQDASCALMNARGEVIAQHVVLPLHIGAFPACAAAVLAAYGGDMEAGDAFLINHPYEGGSPHAPDMAVLTPVFVAGELFGFCGSIAHKSDIGGPVPGSCSGQAKEIFNEGLHLPAVRYQSRQATNGEIERIIAANSRTPELVLGDLRGQLGADRLGEKRLLELVAKYGSAKILTACARLFEVSAAKFKAAIAEWQDGVFTAERFIDDDGIDLNHPVRLHVRIEKQGDAIHFDFSQSDDQTRGPANIRPPLVQAACVYCLISLIDPHAYVNSGLFSAFRVTARAGSVVNPRFPAPVNTYNPTIHAVVDAIFEAVSNIVPAKVRADGCGSRSIIIGGRSTYTGKTYVQYEIVGGGAGARANKDGASGTTVNQTNAKIAPVEIIESEFPTRVLRFDLIADSGGAGEFRGGLGIRREYLNLQDARFSIRSAKHVIAPNGFRGGLAGRTGDIWINPERAEAKHLPTRYADYPLKAGDVFRLDTPGGGGFGDPLDRDGERVLADLREGYISAAAAERDYGVVLVAGESSFALNRAQTERLRAKLKAERNKA